MKKNTPERREMLNKRRERQNARSESDPEYNPPKLKTGKQYNYEGKR